MFSYLSELNISNGTKTHIIIEDVDSIGCCFFQTFSQIHFLVVVSEIKSDFLQPVYFIICACVANNFAPLKYKIILKCFKCP